MPFTMPIPRPFTDSDITNYAPRKGKGIYGLRDGQGWIHIDEYNNLEQILRDIFDEKTYVKRRPTYFEFEACEDDAERERRLQELRSELL